jgi:hypothetical protein
LAGDLGGFAAVRGLGLETFAITKWYRGGEMAATGSWVWGVGLKRRKNGEVRGRGDSLVAKIFGREISPLRGLAFCECVPRPDGLG